MMLQQQGKSQLKADQATRLSKVEMALEALCNVIKNNPGNFYRFSSQTFHPVTQINVTICRSGIYTLKELFLVPPSAPWLVYQRLWYVLSCLGNGAYKRTHAANQKE